MSDKITKSPQIRFAGFTDDWEQRKLSKGMTEYTERVLIEDDKVYKQVSVKNIGEINLRGEQEGSKIGRKRQAKVNLTKYPNTLIFTRQTIEQGGIGFAPKETDGAIVTENMPTISVDTNVFDRNYIITLVKTAFWRKNVILSNIEGGTAQIAIHEDNILKSEVLFPKINEQQKIGTFFKQLDDIIILHQRKLELLKGTKKSLLQKMFTKDGANVPEIRFAGFTDDWEQRKLSKGMTEYTERVLIEDNKVYKQVSVKNIGEINLRGEQEGSKIGRKRQAKVNLTKYPNTLIFTRQTIEQGGIGFAPKETDGAIVTENMPTISVDTNVFDRNYIITLVKTALWRKNVILSNIEGGTAQIAIHEDNILKSEVLFPEIIEQQKIGTFFKQLDDIIILHQRKLDSLKNLKKSLLHQMFL